jgi:serine phosphatase RsbU (regulator of sigma subunit)
MRQANPVGGGEENERLRSLQILTDTALGRLDVEALLIALLDRVRDVLQADTATILLREPGSPELVARASRGIEAEVLQNVRVPLRTGFARRIATEKRPVFLDRVDETTVVNPILWEKGIRTMLGVPLLVGERFIGVLHVGRLATEQFTAMDAELLEVVAERVAFAAQTRLLEVERAASRLLEGALLPRRLPNCAGLEFEVRYASAEGRDVGGDWYDVFVLPSGELWVIVGDVSGRGLSAAVVMGRIRSTMRAYALEDHPCEEVVTLTNRKVLHFEFSEMATVLCATSLPPYEEFRICSAGHPPPVVVVPGKPSEPLDIQPTPPLGVRHDVKPACTVARFSPGSLLVLYTDGLVERRDEAMDVGLQRLCAAISLDHPQVVCSQIMRLLVDGSPPDDDIALVVVRRSQPEH